MDLGDLFAIVVGGQGDAVLLAAQEAIKFGVKHNWLVWVVVGLEARGIKTSKMPPKLRFSRLTCCRNVCTAAFVWSSGLGSMVAVYMIFLAALLSRW